MNNKTKQGGLGIVSVLTIIFIVLKLLGVIKWSWIWVLSPLWISAVIVLAVFSVILIAVGLKRGNGNFQFVEQNMAYIAAWFSKEIRRLFLF